MKNKSLKVQPARKIYQPKYPSYLDKNPLLHPETRPYPFTHKFINWVSTGGLAGAMLFCGSDLSAQTKTDSLYNPFRLENAGVPYMPVSFGTGLPQRLKSEEAMKVIRKAFADSGIELLKNVWHEKAGVLLSGYSQKDKIGFIYLNGSNMDRTFSQGGGWGSSGHFDYDFESRINDFKGSLEHRFQSFLKNKEKEIEQINNSYPRELQEEYVNQLSNLEPIKESEELFNQYYLGYQLKQKRYELKRKRHYYDDDKDQLKIVMGFKSWDYIDSRFEDSIEKCVLLDLSDNLRKPPLMANEFYLKYLEAFNNLKEITSDQEFIKKYLLLIEFFNYRSKHYSLEMDARYQSMKIEIMKSSPIEKWMDSVGRLDTYRDRKFLSLKDAKILDKDNSEGTMLIALIFSSDPMMIIPNSYQQPPPDSLAEEQRLLDEEFKDKDEKTMKILAQKEKELIELTEKYPYIYLTDGTEEERDSVNRAWIIEKEKINKKYEALVPLSPEEQSIYRGKTQFIKRKIRKWQGENQKNLKVNTLRNLEENVKIYIKWAKSQMGG